MRPAEFLVVDGARLRVGPWRGDEQVAYLIPAADTPPCRPDAARNCLSLLARRGYRRVVTAALPPLDQAGFLAVGFEVREHLHLLSLELAHARPVEPPGGEPAAGLLVRRARRHDRAEVLDVDHQAFGPFWQLDQCGLADALAATPVARFRVALSPFGDPTGSARIQGYSIVGRAGRRGYIQRLAVRPAAQREGVGHGLLTDGLRWLGRRGAKIVMVNTQESNTRALALYERHGFQLQPGGLAVLTADVS